MKSTLFGNRVRVAFDVYQTVVKDFQANIAAAVTANNAAPLRTYPANIPEVKVKGAEMDFAAMLLPGLGFRASLAYADGEYSDYPAGPCPLEWQNPNSTASGGCQPLAPPAGLANQTVNPRGNADVPGAYILTGLPLAGLSKWAGSAGIDFAQPLGTGTFVAHADWSVRSGYNSDTTSSQYTWIGGYGIVSASIGYQFSDKWEVDVFARNLLNKDYLTALTVQSGNSGLILGQSGDPRLVGMTLRAKF